jgi:hypothetical protein
MELAISRHIVSDVLDLNIGWGMGCRDGVYCPPLLPVNCA